jgi:ABC transporter substrate binding protein (PQQ-dependent alcohol dehydrogenase system)
MEFSSTIIRLSLVLVPSLVLVAAFGLSSPAPMAAQREEFTFVYLSKMDDTAYAEQRAYTGMKLRERKRPLPGALTALREVRILGRALGLSFKLESVEMAPEADAAQVLRATAEKTRAEVYLLDLPRDETAALAAAFADEEVILFNIRHGDVALRQEACSPVLFHTYPSNAMLMDALAQFLVARNWPRVLVLEGEAEANKRMSAVFQASARKFGLDVVGVHPFVLSNDPRQRDQNNVSLLTAEPKHDVVFLADDHGEFGRYVPYSTHHPRPVVGSEGLSASAWHWTWERHGAPQLNQRFDRTAERRMSSADWAAWAAIRTTVEAIARSGETAPERLRGQLSHPGVTFDLYKGNPGSFRSWNRQLRQPILLHTHNAVIERAPLEGFLHAKNNLDTLGIDEPESLCRN